MHDPMANAELTDDPRRHPALLGWDGCAFRRLPALAHRGPDVPYRPDMNYQPSTEGDDHGAMSAILLICALFFFQGSDYYCIRSRFPVRMK
jgi:hypothetical protein